MTDTLELWRQKVREKLAERGWPDDDIDRRADEIMEPLRRHAAIAEVRSERAKRRFMSRGCSKDAAEWLVIELRLRRIERFTRIAARSRS